MAPDTKFKSIIYFYIGITFVSTALELVPPHCTHHHKYESHHWYIIIFIKIVIKFPIFMAQMEFEMNKNKIKRHSNKFRIDILECHKILYKFDRIEYCWKPQSQYVVWTCIFDIRLFSGFQLPPHRMTFQIGLLTYIISTNLLASLSSLFLIFLVRCGHTNHIDIVTKQYHHITKRNVYC